MRIIGPPSESRALVEGRLREFPIAIHTRFFGEMFPALWSAAERYLVDPVGVVAQSIHETGGGMFPRKVKPWFHNTCGLRVRYVNDVQALLAELGPVDGEHPLTHQMFANWEEGALAHVQHLRAYAGWPVVGDPIVDPRYTYVLGRHAVENFDELGGKWAPRLGYGTDVVRIARMLQGKT